MVECGNGLRFPVEALTEFLECRQLVSDQFDRDRAAQTGITRTKNLAHASEAQYGLELIGTDLRSRTEISLTRHVGHPVRGAHIIPHEGTGNGLPAD